MSPQAQLWHWLFYGGNAPWFCKSSHRIHRMHIAGIREVCLFQRNSCVLKPVMSVLNA